MQEAPNLDALASLLPGSHNLGNLGVKPETSLLAYPPPQPYPTRRGGSAAALDNKEDVLRSLARTLVIPVSDGRTYKAPIITLSNETNSNLYTLVERHLRPEFTPGAERWWKVRRGWGQGQGMGAHPHPPACVRSAASALSAACAWAPVPAWPRGAYPSRCAACPPPLLPAGTRLLAPWPCLHGRGEERASACVPHQHMLAHAPPHPQPPEAWKACCSRRPQAHALASGMAWCNVPLRPQTMQHGPLLAW